MGPPGPRVLKFDGAFGPEGCGGGFAAVIKGARLTAQVVAACRRLVM